MQSHAFRFALFSSLILSHCLSAHLNRHLGFPRSDFSTPFTFIPPPSSPFLPLHPPRRTSSRSSSSSNRCSNARTHRCCVTSCAICANSSPTIAANYRMCWRIGNWPPRYGALCIRDCAIQKHPAPNKQNKTAVWNIFCTCIIFAYKQEICQKLFLTHQIIFPSPFFVVLLPKPPPPRGPTRLAQLAYDIDQWEHKRALRKQRRLDDAETAAAARRLAAAASSSSSSSAGLAGTPRGLLNQAREVGQMEGSNIIAPTKE